MKGSLLSRAEEWRIRTISLLQQKLCNFTKTNLTTLKLSLLSFLWVSHILLSFAQGHFINAETQSVFTGSSFISLLAWLIPQVHFFKSDTYICPVKGPSHNMVGSPWSLNGEVFQHSWLDEKTVAIQSSGWANIHGCSDSTLCSKSKLSAE